MAFTDTTSAPRIYDDKNFATETLTYYFGTPTTYTRTITTERLRHTCLTRAAADSIAEAKNDTHTTATSQRQNNANMYQVVVTSDTYSDWSLVS